MLKKLGRMLGIGLKGSGTMTATPEQNANASDPNIENPQGVLNSMMGNRLSGTATPGLHSILLMKKGGRVSSTKPSKSVSSASKRADGCAMRGKTRGKMV
jgi:hypothetical protein